MELYSPEEETISGYTGNTCYEGQCMFVLVFSREEYKISPSLSITDRCIHDCQLWLMILTFLVLDVRAGSTFQQLQGALLLASICCRVQRSVAQQICAADVWGLLPAELQRTHKTKTDGSSGAKCPAALYYSAEN